MSWLPVAVWLLPGLAGLSLWLSPAGAPWRRPLALGASLAQLALAVALVRVTASGTVLIHAFGGWQPPFGIVFAADRLSALLVLLSSLLMLVTVWTLRPQSHGSRTVERGVPLLFLLACGLSGAFLTGDLFHLFVAFEVVLLASYGLLQVPGSDRATLAAFPNVAINLLASLFFFLGVGLLYGRLGTVNLADLAVRLGDAPAAPEVFAVYLLTLAFGIKAGLVPLLFWLPATYPVTAGPIAAFFAGMMTKLGVFSLLRLVPLLTVTAPVSEILVWVGSLSALFGGLAALSEIELRRLLGFHIVSQVGYMVLGLGLLTAGALAAAIFYLAHHILVKATLYFVADELERASGSRDLRRMLRPRAGRAGLAVIFLSAALSLAGLPPLSGFFAKLGLFFATFEAAAWGPLAVLAVASVLTLASMLKIWRLAFAGEPPAAERPESATASETSSLWLLVAASILLAAAAGPCFQFAEATARQLLDMETYRGALPVAGQVLGVAR